MSDEPFVPLDLKRIRLVAGVPYNQIRDMSGYRPGPVVGKTVEFVGQFLDDPNRTVLFFTGGTYFECETWLT